MNYQIIRLLEPQEVELILSDLQHQTFTDGKLTAAGKAKEVKYNLQFVKPPNSTSEIERVLTSAFQRNPDFQTFAIPKRMKTPMFSRYEPGMEYGSHIDNALMAGMRTDLSVTVFLSPPTSYDGGELVLDLPTGSEEIKLDAGEAVVYSTMSIHHVARVTRGVRVAAVTWVQSAIRDERLRSILYDLGQCSKEANNGDRDRLSLLLSKSYHNLIRYAAEP